MGWTRENIFHDSLFQVDQISRREENAVPRCLRRNAIQQPDFCSENTAERRAGTSAGTSIRHQPVPYRSQGTRILGHGIAPILVTMAGQGCPRLLQSGPELQHQLPQPPFGEGCACPCTRSEGGSCAITAAHPSI